MKGGATVAIEHDAGLAAGFTDAQYVTAGATIAPDFAAATAGAELVCKVQPPTTAEIAMVPEGSALICYLQPSGNTEAIAALAGRKEIGRASCRERV